ncbi:MAG: hypothetical protein ACTSSG_13105 [Candidatus Heimdallarchaeaceae archaeon]
MTSTTVRIDSKLYDQLQEHAYKKHRSFKCVKKELEEAVIRYLAKHEQEKEN